MQCKGFELRNLFCGILAIFCTTWRQTFGAPLGGLYQRINIFMQLM